MKPYPEYKDSGVEWIGKIPEHWRIDRLKWACNFIYGNSLASLDREEGVVPVYGSNGVTGYHDKAITEAPCIIIGRKGSYGKVNISMKPCFPIDTTYFVDKRYTSNEILWLKYILPTLGLDSFSKDTGVPGLSREEAYSKPVITPPLSEQKQIAKYLDHKTAQIDSLIEKKKRLIELFREERTAVINQAVTKGLDPNVPMKDSGIEWLGEIPAHWEVKRLKYESKTNREALPETTRPDYEFEYIDIGNVSLSKINDTPKLFSFGNAPSRARRVVKKGDTILSTVRTYLKAITYIDMENENLIASTGFAVITPGINLNPKYLSYLMISEKIIDTICSLSTGVSYPAVNSSDVENIPIWYPNLTEQNLIVGYIEKETTRIDTIISKSEKEITLLQEYRTALISEVVTGKIDVREERI